MTPRERVLAVLRGDPAVAGKVPFTVYETMIPQCAVERRLRNEGLCIVHRLTQPYVTDRPNCRTEMVTSVEGGKERAREVIRTPVGEVSTVREPAGFTAWTIERLFKGPEDYRVLRFIAEDTQYRPDYQAYLEAEQWMGDDVILRGQVGLCPLHEIMIHWMGAETFGIEWSERRDEVLKLEAAMRASRRRVYSVLADSPITHANFGGKEVPEVMGPERYREFSLPLFDECAEVFHKKGKLLGTHLDGNNKPWAQAVAASGLDYIEAFTPAPDTDMTVEEALAAWPDKVLWINFPSSVHLADVGTIKRTTREIIDAAAGTNRLIIGITENMPPDRWQENMSAISEVINSG